MAAYYNEINPYAAQWLRNLIAAGHIAAGDVDERSITDVRPDDLESYTQCHFFAGVGVWSRALRLAGWPDDKPVWTGSCPCQPFSVAGAGKGVTDERHLWPVWYNLIKERNPSTVFGEQVEAAIRHGWLDLVQDDLESSGYTTGAICLPAACTGAPHIRQRLWFVADSRSERRNAGWNNNTEYDGNQFTAGGQVSSEWLADTTSSGQQGSSWSGSQKEQRVAECGVPSSLGDTNSKRFNQQPIQHQQWQKDSEITWASSLGGFWDSADWLYCRDEKYRPVESGTFPLAHGASSRVGRLCAYGNAIVPQVAAEVISTYMEWKK